VNVPEPITETVLVFEPFVHAGDQYVHGDRLPVRHRWVRRVAREHPDWFRVEYAPEDIDLHWLDSMEDDAERRYQAVVRAREEAKARGERALREELTEQTRSQPDLERRLVKQEAEQRKREEQMREERKREEAERAIELRGGFNF
jgi:hypothetical protein